MSTLKEVSESNFDTEVLQSKVPVLVDFFATWCGPCKALAPKLEELASELGDKAMIVKVDVDQNPDLAVRYGIKGMPTMLLFKAGEAKTTLVGNQPKDAIQSAIQEVL